MVSLSFLSGLIAGLAAALGAGFDLRAIAHRLHDAEEPGEDVNEQTEARAAPAPAALVKALARSHLFVLFSLRSALKAKKRSPPTLI